MSGETKRVVLEWRERLVFQGGEVGGPTTVIDGDNALGPGPMLTLLLAAGACSGADVVSILEKMRVPPQSLRIDLSGVRRDTEPRRYLSIHFAFHLTGQGLDEARARRAIELSLTKYCSVVSSLAPDIAVTYGIALG
jgi:putative redox protein